MTKAITNNNNNNNNNNKHIEKEGKYLCERVQLLIGIDDMISKKGILGNNYITH